MRLVSSKRSGSLASLRESNRDRVIDALRDRGLASRAGLALEREGGPDGEAQAGRPPVMVALDSSAGIALGIDFGHRHLRVAVSDLSHTGLAEEWCELDVDHSADEGLGAAAGFVEQVLAEVGVDRSRVIGAVMGL